jgi:LAS superfamily LD-carboxypeptidase LdcB
MNKLELTGRTDSHIDYVASLSLAACKETIAAFIAMKAAAAKEGLSLSAYSSFRDFKSQLEIWNAKFSGQRPLFDRNGEPLVYNTLSEERRIQVILFWSALPGASRHHWGTEIDVIDSAAIPDSYQVQLLPAEFETGGVFYNLHRWLDQNMERFGFFKPYREFRGGVSEEPWHLSYAPLSGKLLDQLSLDMINEAVAESELLGKKYVMEILPDIYATYVLNICD